MKKNYTLKSRLPLFFLFLFSCLAIGQRNHTVVEKKVAKSNTTVAPPKGNSPSVFYNSIKRTSPISESVARQSNGVSSTVLDVCDIDQSNFNFPDTTTSISYGQSFMAQCNSDMTSVSISLGTTTPSTPIMANIYAGETVTGSSIGSATVPSGIVGENIFTFSTPIPILSGQVYSIILTSTDPFTVPYSNLDPYPDGNASDGFVFFPGIDLVFKVTTCGTLVAPTFTPVAAICAGDILAALPTTSDNSIVGTWSPALDNTTTTTYTFTPDVSQCASTTTLTITVVPITQNTTNIVACDSYIWPVNGNTYTFPGVYNEIIGCNTETLNLSIIPIQTVAIMTPSLACENNTLTLTATSSTAQLTDFTGVFDISNWNLSNTNADGNVVTTGAPTSIEVSGGNNGSANPGDTDYTITAPFTGIISFNWDYATGDDPEFDVPNFLVDGNSTVLTGYDTLGATNQSGTMTVNVTAGQIIGFKLHTVDNIFGAATVAISNFTAILSPQIQWVASDGGTIVGPNNQLNLDVITSGTYTLTNTIGTCSASDFVAITFNPNVIPTFTQVDPICSGDTLTALPTTSDNGITGTWSPALDNSTTTVYTFSPDADQCATTASMTITVTPSTSNTTTLSECETFTWLENGTTYTSSGIYTSLTGCHTEILNLTITPLHTIAIATPGLVCENSPLTLTATTTPVQINNFTEDFNVVNWTLSNTNADGVINTTGAPNSIALTGGNNGSVDFGNTNYTITVPSSGTISFDWSYSSLDDAIFDIPNILINGSPTVFTGYDTSGSSNQSGSMTINVSAGQTLSFNVYTEDNLFGAPTVVISNFIANIYPQLQWVATNGGTIVGPTNLLSVNVTTSGTYTIYAADGICPPFSDVVDITFSPILTPTFTQVDPICEGGILSALPTTSNNNITGTWTPALDNNTTTPYTFTPNSGQCATSASMTVTVNPNTTIGDITTTICDGDSYTWSANGVTYTTAQSGVTYVSGCNTATLNLTITPSTSITTTVAVCDTYTWSENGTTYTSSGLYSVVSGCHTELLDLTITPSTSNTTTVAVCDTYIWSENGTTYTSSGLYSVVSGCHTELLDLTITPSTSNTATVAVCDTYTWSENGTTYTSSGLYSVVSGCHTELLDLTITPSTSNTTTVAVCDTYIWSENGTTYTASGLYSVVSGCHTELLDLTINSTSEPTGNATQIISVLDANDATITSILVSPTNVIWYGSLLDAQSATNPLAANTILTTGATYYAVNVVGTCSSTPFAVTVTVALGNEHFETVNFSFYPNPTSSILNIKYSKEISSVSVYNLLGQLLMSDKTNATEVQINLLNLPTEAYFVKVVSEGLEKVIKVMKK